MIRPYKKVERDQKKVSDSRQEQKLQEKVTASSVEVKERVPVTQQTDEPAVIKAIAKEIFLAGMLEKKPIRKSCGFYPGDEVVAEIDKLAHQNKSNLFRNMFQKKFRKNI